MPLPETSHLSEPPAPLKNEYEYKRALFAAQPGIVQRFIEAQARQVADALVDHQPYVKFSLPDRVVVDLPRIDQPATVTVPPEAREQNVGGFKNRLLRRDVREEVRHRLNELEQSPDQAISTSASLLRFGIAQHFVYTMLPSGRSVKYHTAEDESIPSIPVEGLEPKSAITQDSDAIVEEGAQENGRGELQVPYVPAARRFYLPQWVSFDEEDRLLVGSTREAEAHIASMQRYVAILHAASSIAPYFIADDTYQKKRYGMLGQLVNQGRALARHKTREIIATIKERAAAGSLNRGLSLSLPYFDDQELALNLLNMEVIPAGRIMFVPAFVVRAAREEAAKRAQDTRFNHSTRKHILGILSMLEAAFHKPG